MVNIKKTEDCVGCGACMQRCPTRCIVMLEDEQGFLYPKIDNERCKNCGVCEKVCPVINQANSQKPTKVYAAWHKDNEIRFNSSSGGIFYALAKQVIDENGVVFGASFNDDWEVVHICVETIDDLQKLQGSKYVQSKIEESYSCAEKFLNSGRKVMFVGTPCQIIGLHRFLSKNYGAQLLKVDLVCHGTPSPLFWRNYLSYKTHTYSESQQLLSTNCNGYRIKNINFRDKRFGWNKFGFTIHFTDIKNSKISDLQSSEKDSELFEPMTSNLYMKSFLSDLNLRPSCFACPARGGKSLSDLTLSDYWGVKQKYPSLYDRKGVSLIMENSYNGSMALKSCEQIHLTSVPYNDGIIGNPAIYKNPIKPKEYDVFWQIFWKDGICGVKQFFDAQRPNLIIRCLNKVLRRIKFT